MGNTTRTIPYRVVNVDLATARNSWPSDDPANGAGPDAKRIQVKENRFEILYAPGPFYIHLGHPDAPGILVPEGYNGTPEACDGAALEAVYISNDAGAGEVRILTGPVQANFKRGGSQVPDIAGADAVGVWSLSNSTTQANFENLLTAQQRTYTPAGGIAARTGKVPNTDPNFPGLLAVRITIPGTEPANTEVNLPLFNNPLQVPPVYSLFANAGPDFPDTLYRAEDVIAGGNLGGPALFMFGFGVADTAAAFAGIGFTVVSGNALKAFVRSDQAQPAEVNVNLTDDDGNNIFANVAPLRLTLDVGFNQAGPFARWYVNGVKRHEWIGQRFDNEPADTPWKFGYLLAGGAGGGAQDTVAYFGMGGGPSLHRFPQPIGS